jgi:tRNA(adenine34) deaminase
LAAALLDCYNIFTVTNMNFINSEDERWMRMALEEAKIASARDEVPVGAVAIFDEKIIGRGYNRKETDSDPTGHAEILALREAAIYLGNWRLLNVTLYSTLEPCIMCAGAMIQARLFRVVYGAKDLRFGADGSVVDLLSNMLFNHQVLVTSGILQSDSAALLRGFFRSLREGE